MILLFLQVVKKFAEQMCAACCKTSGQVAVPVVSGRGKWQQLAHSPSVPINQRMYGTWSLGLHRQVASLAGPKKGLGLSRTELAYTWCTADV